jgi:hypothetical protein
MIATADPETKECDEVGRRRRRRGRERKRVKGKTEDEWRREERRRW